MHVLQWTAEETCSNQEDFLFQKRTLIELFHDGPRASIQPLGSSCCSQTQRPHESECILQGDPGHSWKTLPGSDVPGKHHTSRYLKHSPGVLPAGPSLFYP